MKKGQKKLCAAKAKSPRVASKKVLNVQFLEDLEKELKAALKGNLPALEGWDSMPTEPGLWAIVQELEEKRDCTDGELMEKVEKLRAREAKSFLRLRFGDMFGSWQEFAAWTFPSGFTIYTFEMLDCDDIVILAATRDGFDEATALRVIDAMFEGQIDSDGTLLVDITRASTRLTIRSPTLNKILHR